ncbi:MAG: hypothetical protein D6690_02000 [Nitrospirae bacterium]|nr:MAG: hypothetical protein D6690_02000 [Nitrospirota bacterium]
MRFSRRGSMSRVRAALLSIGFLTFAFTVRVAFASEFSVAFYYGEHPPVDELQAFDVAVIDPDHGLDPRTYRTATSELFAYVSVGELEPYRSFADDVPRNWIIGENTAWESAVVDLAQPGWATFLVQRIIGPLWERGFRGFFLDTLDSYHLVATTPTARHRQEAGLIAIVRAIKTAYPEAKLIMNRGFEIIPAVSHLVFAVAVESLFQGWDQGAHRYVTISRDERQWLIESLTKIKRDHRLPIIVIDYVPPHERERARAIARDIRNLGMIPWISNPELDQLGVGLVEVMPRKVLAVFDGGDDPDPAHSELHRYLDMPLNYLGYIPEHWNIADPLPSYSLVGRYAGIVAWLPRNRASWSRAWHRWLVEQIRHGMRVAMFESFGFPLQAPFLEPFDLASAPPPRHVDNVTLMPKDPRVGYEIEPVADRRAFVPLRLHKGHTLLQVRDSSSGERSDVLALTEWGGYALRPYALVHLPDGHSRWIIDPIRFLRDALQLPPMPVPDTTTELGRRLLLVHIDGDGFPSRAELPGTPYAGEVLYREILVRYPVPSTVSVIEGEIGPTGLYPDQSSELEAIARDMFTLPHVELASHSYSHPFFWREFLSKGPTRPGHYHLPVPHYRYGPDAYKREILGSIEYINRRLAPPGKRVTVFLWTGDCDPPPEAVGETYAGRVLNMNGGDTVMTQERHTLTAVAPLGINKGGHFQVYAPNQNENLYTHQWRGPFYGYQEVLETFALTDRPRRLKPINIYYHMYSASKAASLAALHTVYRWALEQDVFPVYASQYIRKVLDFQTLTIAKQDEQWQIRGAQHLRELRIPRALGFPDLRRSRGVVGFSDHEEVRYLHLSGDDEIVVALATDPPREPYIGSGNVRISQWTHGPQRLAFQAHHDFPLDLRMANIRQCHLRSGHDTKHVRAKGESVRLYTARPRVGSLTISCDR